MSTSNCWRRQDHRKTWKRWASSTHQRWRSSSVGCVAKGPVTALSLEASLAFSLTQLVNMDWASKKKTSYPSPLGLWRPVCGSTWAAQLTGTTSSRRPTSSSEETGSSRAIKRWDCMLAALHTLCSKMGCRCISSRLSCCSNAMAQIWGKSTTARCLAPGYDPTWLQPLRMVSRTISQLYRYITLKPLINRFFYTH